MPKVLILGAGASYGHGYGTIEDNRPPLVNGFFVHPLFNTIRNDYAKLINYLQETLGIEKESLNSTNIEALIGQIEPLWSLHIFDRKVGVEYEYDEQFELVNPLELMRSFIADIIFLSTKWLSKDECPYHDRLVRKWISEGDTIISFNYDLIIDTSLRKNSTWKESTGYGWNAKEVTASYIPEKWWEQEGEYIPANVRLLKPHGSINFSRSWRLRTEKPTKQSYSILGEATDKETKSAEVDSIAVTPLNKFWTKFKPRLLPKLCRLYSEEYNHDQKEYFQIWNFANKGKDSYERGVLPLLIAPTPYKPFHQMCFAELQDVWKQVFQSLQNAEQIISCGFSFSDEHFNQILKEATRKKQTPLNLKIVDPSIQAINEITNKLSGCKLEITPIMKCFSDFVQSFN